MLKKPRISGAALQIVFCNVIGGKIYLQKVMDVNEARGISRMSPDPLSRRLGLGTRLQSPEVTRGLMVSA